VIAQYLDAIERGQAGGAPWAPTGWTLAASLPPRDLLLLPADIAGQEEGAAVEAQPEEAPAGADVSGELDRPEAP